MSDTNRVGLRIRRNAESAAPITLSPLTLQALRMTGTPNLGFVPETIVTNEISPDRQISDLIPVGAEAGGDVGFELSFGSFDELIESTLFSSWVETGRETGTGITFAANTINVTDGTSWLIGNIVRLFDVATGTIGDGTYVITNIVTNALTVAAYDANTIAIAGTETSDADTNLIIVGYQSEAAGEFDTTIVSNIVTLTASGASAFTGIMGPNQSVTDLVPGQWMKISGFLAINAVWARLIAVGATTLTFDQATDVAAESPAGLAEIWFGDYVINGAEATASHQFAVERRFEDHTPITRELFLAMAMNQMAIDFQPKSIVTGTGTFFGQDSVVSDDSPNYADLYSTIPVDVAANTNAVYNTSSNVGRIGRGASPVSAGGKNFVTAATMNINNNLRRKNAVGVFGASGIGSGEFSVTGDLNAYFDDKTLLDAVINGTRTSLDITVVSNDKKAITFDLPAIEFASGSPQVPGKNEDTTIDLSYQAVKDSTLLYTMLVQRGYYAV